MNLFKYKIILLPKWDVPRYKKGQYYSVSTWILEDVDSIKKDKFLLFSPLKFDWNNFYFFITVKFEETFLENFFEYRKFFEMYWTTFEVKEIKKVREFNLVEYQPTERYDKFLFTIVSPAFFKIRWKRVFFDIQPILFFSSINRKLLRLWININLDLIKVEKNVSLVWFKNLNTVKIYIRNKYKLWMIWKLFYKIESDDSLFKKQIDYLVNVSNFLWVWQNVRVWLGNVSWSIK
jgi:hypothetical protein